MKAMTMTITQWMKYTMALAVLAVALTLSSGVTGAAPAPIGVTECDQAGCAVVTTDTLKTRATAKLASPMTPVLDQLRPHLTP